MQGLLSGWTRLLERQIKGGDEELLQQVGWEVMVSCAAVRLHLHCNTTN